MNTVRRFRFTLLELITVIVIIAIGTSVSVSVLRKRSGGTEFTQRCDSFRDFCLVVRRQAMESGKPRSIFFLSSERCFEAGDPPAAAGSEISPLTPPPELDPVTEPELEAESPPAKRWEIPENFTAQSPDWQEERLEVFRFYPDGGTFQTAELALKYGNFRSVFRIQPLTGRLLTEEEAL